MILQRKLGEGTGWDATDELELTNIQATQTSLSIEFLVPQLGTTMKHKVQLNADELRQVMRSLASAGYGKKNWQVSEEEKRQAMVVASELEDND